MRNFNTEAFFEALKDKMIEMGELFIEYGVPNFETYSPEEDDIQNVDLKEIVSIMKDANDAVNRNI